MAVILRGSTTGPNDLDIMVRNSGGSLIDPYRLEYAIYDFTTGLEVLMGSPVNTPVKIATGHYYALFVIPGDANIGNWRIRWTIQETVADPVYQSVEDFNVVGSNVIPSFTGDLNMDRLIYSLRILLRDNNPDRNYSVDGKEKIKIRVKNKEYVLSLEEFYNIIEEGRNGYKKTKMSIYKAFLNNEIMVQSVSIDKRIRWSPVTDVTRHNVTQKMQYKVSLENGKSCTVTEDHSLFLNSEATIQDIKTKNLKINDNIAYVKNGQVISKKIISNLIVPSMNYMYDLSVPGDENFILESGILAHNSFRPPASEKFIQGQTQVFGFIWEDEELLEYLYMAVDDFNSRPPVTGIDISNLWSSERRWRTTVLIRAAVFACFAISMNWISNEFSVGGKESITVKDADNNDYSLTIEELYEIIYSDILNKMKRRAKEECAAALKEIENETY